MAETCETCRFWKRRKAESRGGWCRRHAPVTRQDIHQTEWPAVADVQWCGDYEPFSIDCATGEHQVPEPLVLTDCPSCGAQNGHLHEKTCEVRALKSQGMTEADARARLFPGGAP